MTSGGRSTATRCSGNKLRMGRAGRPVPRPGAGADRLLGVLREDGMALEVGGISDEAVDEFSTRSKELRDKARELERAYEQKHGHAPGKRAWWAIRQQAALEDPGLEGPQPAARRPAGRRRGRAKRSGAGSGRCPRSTKRPRRYVGGARAERAAERGGAAEHHPPGRRRGADGERTSWIGRS